MSRNKASQLTPREAACFGPRDMKDPRSVEWAYQSLELLKSYYERKEFTLKNYQTLLEEIKAQQAWDRVPPEKPYGSLDELLKGELGVESEEESIRQKRERQEEVEGTREAGKQGRRDASGQPRTEGGRFAENEEPKGTASTFRQSRGACPDYLLSRLKRDAADPERPNQKRAAEALEKYISGELPSVRQAGIYAGIIKVPTPLDLLTREWRKATDAQRDDFIAKHHEQIVARLKHLGWLQSDET